MLVTVEAKAPAEVRGDLLAIPLLQLPKGELRLPARVVALDRETGGRIAAVIESGDFRGKSGQTLCLYPDGDLGARRVLLVGLGDEKAADLEALRCAAGSAVVQAASRQAARVTLPEGVALAKSGWVTRQP